ncbi:MAG: hypothetical protein DRI24_01750 [Deltaproteobacteria bacterium]|nr:MAG: hypothetical protein DRI24_01750 [Deltaproteobacteria bacterium]
MSVRTKSLRSSSPGIRPTPGSRDVGELYTNYPDGQLGVIDTNQDPQDLIAVRYFSALAAYVVDDVIVNVLDNTMYRCIQDNGPGAFTPTDWTTAADSFVQRLKGYETNGLHSAFTGDLNTLLHNSTYTIIASGVTNDPAEFSTIGFITTNLWTATSAAIQTLTGMTGADQGRVWFRTRDGSVWGNWFIPNDLSMTAAVQSFAVPPNNVGSIWLLCDGQAVSRDDYADLFLLLDVIYGNGDGTTTFNIPNYQGQFLRGQDQGAGVDPDAGTRTDRGDGVTGDEVGTKQEGGNLSHDHGITDPGHTHSNGNKDGSSVRNSGTDRWSRANVGTSVTGISIKARGGNEARPTNVNVLYYINTGRV